jgi:hypothetical protein
LSVDQHWGDVARDGAPALSRRSFLAGALACGASVALPGAVARAAPSGAIGVPCLPPGFRTSLSVISPFSEEVLAAVALTDGMVTAKSLTELQQMYNRHGATEVYMRIATKKVAGQPTGVQRAAFARALGMPFNPELGLFGNYGDAATYQEPPDFSDYPSIHLPGPWISLTLEQMLPPMREYGALAARELLNTGVTVNYWDLGNEVENGIAGVAVYPLFPTSAYQAPNNVDAQIGLMSVPTLVAMPESERIAWCQLHLWPYVGRLLAAAAQGIRSVDPTARFSTHISDFGQRSPAVQLAFWDTVNRAGYLPDLFGTSYYPTDGRTDLGASDRVSWLRGIASGLHSKYGRQLFISEYGYPSALMQPPYVFNDTVPGYPQTPAGQHDFTRDLVTWGIESGLLAGIRPWAPDYCTNSGWEPMSWFNPPSGSTATAKPALAAVQEALSAHAGNCFASAPARGSSRLVARFYGRRHARHGVLVRLNTTAGTRSHLSVELRRAGRVLAKTAVAHVGTASREVVLRPHGRHLGPGRYALVILERGSVIIRRSVTLG